MSNTSNLWEHTNSEGIASQSLQDDQSVDLVIIGGGFTGCSAALEAGRSDASVVVLEAESIAHGGSGRNVGLVNAGLWLPPDDVINVLGKVDGTRLIEALGMGPDTVFSLINEFEMDCDAVQNGTLHLAASPSGVRDLEKRARQGNRFGAQLQLLDRDETVLRTGSDQFYGALFDVRAGTVQPRAYCNGLARAAVSLGARIYKESLVTRVERKNGTWCVHANGYTVTARRLLLATNAYHILADGIDKPEHVVVNFCQFATAPMTKEQRETILPGREGCWDTALVMSSIRTDRNGRLIIGGIGNSDGPAAKIHAKWARRKLHHLYPALADIPFEHYWCGKIAMTKDHIPKVVEFGPDAYAIFGYSGRGICPGTVMGTALSKALLSEGSEAIPLPVTKNYSERFKKIMGAYYEFGASLTHAIRPNRLW